MRRLFVVAALCLCFAGAQAQSRRSTRAVPPTVTPPQPAERRNSLPDTRVMIIEPATIDGLTSLSARDDIDAVSLGVSRAALERNNGAWQALSFWVSRGGTVFLHTDAAQLFGYRTVAARLPTARQAGQLFGRARAALPFGGHRLLWGNAARPVRGPRSLSVQTIYYQSAPGDHLAIDHPAGVSLLAVTDLAAAATTRPNYAAAVAPYGRGWAVFTPRFVETHRADGAAFVGNLSRFAIEVASSTRHRLARQFADDDVLPVPAALLDNYGRPTTSGQSEAGPGTWSRLLFPDADGTRQGDQIVRDVTPSRRVEPMLLVTRREIRALAYGLSPDADGPAQEAARALLATLRARLALQRNDLPNAAPWLGQAVQLAPQSAEVLALQATLAVTRGEDIYQPSPDRAAAYADAVRLWDGALRATALSQWLLARDTALPRPETPPSDARRSAPGIAGTARDLVVLWREAAQFMAAQCSVEPPLVQVSGDRGNPVLLRFFERDPQLPILLPTAQSLSRGARTVGWRAAEEEVLLFPTFDYFGNYRRAAGLWNQRPLLPFYQGDASGNRLYLVTNVPQLGTAPAGTVFSTGIAPDFDPAVRLARLHSFALTNALAGGGTPVPAWMQFGLSGLVNGAVAEDVNVASRMQQGYVLSLQSGGLLAPEQFARALASSNTAITTLSQAEAQGYSLMSFFYRRFGAGRVAEMLQRLGAGQSVDEALTATTGLSEVQFFTLWRNTEFGK